MSSFQVYIPGKTGASPNHLRDVGLELLLDPHFGPTAIEAHHDTPDGCSGIVFYWQDMATPTNMPQHMGCHSDQEWSPAKPSKGLPAGRFWLGKDAGGTVTPGALMRHNHMGGLSVKLDDGQEWMVPVARRLPKKYQMDEVTGEPRMQVALPYQEFYKQAEDLYTFLLQARIDEDFTIPGGWTFAERALAMNYRINSDVIDWLGLLGDESMLRLIGATHERNIMLEIDAQKKTAQ